jgi:chorismate mutase
LRSPFITTLAGRGDCLTPGERGALAEPNTTEERGAIGSALFFVAVQGAEMTACRGIRGATTVSENDAGAILNATQELLEQIITENGVSEEDVASVIFTATPDLDAAYPAVAARRLGWTHTSLICVQEMVVPGSLSRCIRVLVHWNTDRAVDEIHHVYLHEARRLRPDLLNGTQMNTTHSLQYKRSRQ